MIYTLDDDGYLLAAVDDSALPEGLLPRKYTRVAPTGNRCINDVWTTVADHRGTWHDPQTGDTTHITAMGEAPPSGWVQGEPTPAAVDATVVARTAAWARIKAARTAQEFGPFTWGGHIFDGNVDAQRRLDIAERRAQRALDAGLTPTVDWTLADNTVLALSAQDVIGVFMALGDNIRDAHDKARILRAQIDAATTISELEAIQWA